MPNITITGGSVCSGGAHRTVVTDRGTYQVSLSQITDAIPDAGDTQALLDAFIIVTRHQYLSRRAAGRNHNQAMSDLVGFTVRL